MADEAPIILVYYFGFISPPRKEPLGSCLKFFTKVSIFNKHKRAFMEWMRVLAAGIACRSPTLVLGTATQKGGDDMLFQQRHLTS
ncbi:MAG: hypothetical protein H5U29_04175 [Pusillimonas sp.]|nr:hypothetical protein [Pusillimonas sp.]